MASTDRLMLELSKTMSQLPTRLLGVPGGVNG
jgi:hypothetical protein